MDGTTIIKEMLPTVFMQRTDVINLIPDVKPNNTISLLRDLILSNMSRIIDAEDGALHNFLGSDPTFELSEEEINWSELTYMNGFHERIVITTIGAKLLIRLFEAGLVEQKKKSSSKDLSRLKAYADSLPELKVQSDQIKKTQEKEKADALYLVKVQENRIKHLIKHPNDAQLEELNRKFLNDYAYAIGPGSQSFKFAGADVEKDVRIMRSNSGKSSTTYVSIRWRLPDGEWKGDDRTELVLNRRNDPKRNWGLGRD